MTAIKTQLSDKWDVKQDTLLQMTLKVVKLYLFFINSQKF